MQNPLNYVLPVIAICISVVVAYLNHRDRIERRHGELSKLRSDLTLGFSAIYHRMQSAQMHLETARLEIRRFPNSDFKYESIERMPPTIAQVQEIVAGIAELKKSIQDINTMTENSGNLLMGLQAAGSELRTIDDKVSYLEKCTLQHLTAIRALQEAEDALEAKQLEVARLKGELDTAKSRNEPLIRLEP
jgi:hypothetical protein